MRLIKLLPEYYEKNVTMVTLQEILSGVTDELDIALSSTIQECFVSTASRLLSRHENMLGLEVDVTKSDEFRRERICAKLSGAGTTTKAMIIDVASRYSNGEAEVLEDNENHVITIKFVGTLGIPGNMADLKMTIEEIKPAHLAVTYEYSYSTWNDLEGMTWEAASAYTWEELRMVRADE